MSDKIKVAIKVRRLIDREESEGLVSQWEVKNNSIFQKDSSGKYREPYSFDHVFDPETNNYEVFNTIARPIIDSSVSGFNGTIFAYGQTSSGKTYTMMGKQHEPGIIPQTIQYIFEAVNKVQGREFLLRASYIEIYNEKVNDLLEKGKTGLKLREVEGTTIICGVKEEVVPTPDKIMKLMKRGENIRRIGETNMNERSSRSHTIFRIIIESRVPNEGEDGVVQVSHLNLVDLAGSERLDQTGSKGDRLKEGCCINRSLFMLSHVISQLSEGQDQYVNFRDSKLTRILQSSLGGNAHTAMICAVTPASIEETSSTLGFASRAINVKNKPHINEVLSDAALLKRYARQIAKLQTELEKTRNKNKTYEVEEIESKLQEEQRRNELLQERIDLMKEQLIGSAATDSVAVDKRRALRRRTWCGHASRKSLSFIAPSLQTIDENSADFFKKECLSTTIQELANNTFFETPLEEFELQLMDAERRLSPDSLDTPCKVTFRKDKSRHVTFDDESELIENQSKKTVEIGSQTEALPINFKVTNTEYGTPPHILRERIMYFQKEYDELREFTTLEKQICNPVNYKEATGLEMQNRHLQKSMSDIEKTVLDVNCINSKLHDENKSLKERLAKETEKCNDIACRLQPVETALSQVSQEVVDLTKQLNVAAQRIKDLENERNDFEMTRELAEARLKTRNKELILSLEDAQMKLKELKQDAEDLTRVSASNFDLKKLQDELIILREENVSYIEELKQKNEYLEQLRQENDELKENDLNICLKNVKEELMSLQKSNFLSIEQLKIKDESLELHIKQIEELKSEREQCLKYIEKCHNQMKQQNEKFTNIHTCTSDVNKEQEEEDSMKEKIDCLETLKHQIEEADLKYTDKLQKKDTYLEEQKEQIQDLKERALNTQELCSKKVLNSATENNLMHTELKAKNEYLELLETVTNHNTELIFAEEGIKMLKDQDMWYNQGSSEKDNHCEILKKHTEHWGSVEIARSKYIDELKEKIVIMQKEITLLKQEKSVTIKEIKEKDGYLEILKKQIQNLDSTIEVNSKYIDELKTNNVTVQKENDSLEEKNSLYREQLRQKDICLETMKQQIEELIGEKEANLTCIDELKANTVSLQTEISSLQENNSVYMRRVKEKNDYLETLKETFEDLNSGKEANLKYIDDLKANIVGLQREINSLQENNSMYMRQVWEKDNCLETLKQQLQDLDCQRKANLTCIDELKANIVSLQKEIPSLEEKYSVYGEQLKEKDNFLETLKQEIEELNCAREKHLKDIDEQKANNECLQKEIISLEEKNSVYMEQLKEKDNYLETLKQEIEKLNCARETHLKDMDELKANNECLQKETISLEENNSVYMEQLKEKDNYIETLKQEIEDMNCARETNLKDIDELKANNECLQKEIISLEEKNSLYIEQLKEKDNYLETLKQEIEDLNCTRETNLKDIDELKANNECLQKEIISLEEKNSLYMEQLKEKDNCLETLKQEIEDLNCARESNLKDINELKADNECLQKEIISLEENISLYMEQLKEKDNYLETLKQEIEDRNCARETNLKDIDELKANNECLQKEIISVEEKNSVYMEQLKENVTYLETVKLETENDSSAREANLKGIDEWKLNVSMEKEINSIKEENTVYRDQLKEKYGYTEALKLQIEDLNSGIEANLKYIDELEANNVSLQRDINSLEEENTMYKEQLKEKDNHLERVKRVIEDINSSRESNLKYIDELETNNVSLQKEIHFLEKKNFVYMGQVKEKDNCLETLKQEIEDLNCARETNVKHNGELKECLQKVIISFEEKNSLYMEQLKEKDNYLVALKLEFEDLNCARETNLKDIDELKANNECLQKEIISLEEKNSLYVEQLKEKNSYLETLRQQIEHLNCATEANLQYIDELKANIASMQTEIHSLADKNSVHGEQLEEKVNYLETLKQEIEDLNCARETNLKDIDELKANNECLQKVIISFEEKNFVYMEQLKEKDNYLEALKQEIEDLNCATNLKDIDEVKANNECLQKDIISLEEKNSVYMEQLKEKDNYLEALKQEIEDMNCARETNLKDIDELKANNECQQKEIISLKKNNSLYMEQLKEKDNYLETLKQEIEELNCARETNLKDINELKANNECLQKEIISLEENNSLYMEQLMEKDNYLETLKQEIEELNCSRETNLKDIDELKANNECLQKEIISLEEKNSLYMEQLKEKDKYLETLKQETEHLNSEREGNLKYIDELKTNVVSLHREINSVEENNSLYMRQVREKDNCLETLKQQLEDLDCQREANLTFIDELKANIVSLQTEMYSLEEKYSMYSEEVKGKGDYLQQLKRHIEEMNSGRETNLKYIDELETNNASLQMQIHSLEERNSVYMEHVKEKHNYLETLKQEFEDLNFAREANLKYIDELKANIASMQTEIHSLADKNSVCGEQLKEKDNYLETLKQEIEERNCAIETNLKDIDELKANNECLQKEIISLVEKNSIYMEQLKERNTYLETVKQEFEDVVYARETNLECGDERQINIRMRKEINSITPYATYREQLKKKDSYIEALKQQIEDMNSENKANLKCIEQLHEKNKYCDSLKYEKEPKSQEYGVLAEEVECCNTHVPSELSVMTGSVSVKSHEIELCRRMMLKEVSYLKPDYDVESLSQSQLTDLLKMLLAFVMEKEMEMFHSLQDQMNEIHTQANEAEKEYANKDRQKDCWIRELEAEIEHLQALVARVEEEKKALEMDDKSHCLALLEQERADLIKKLRQLDSDLVIVQLERNRVESHNKEMARKLEDLQLLLEKKSSQLQEELENQFNKSQKLETLMKEISDLGENNAVLLERLEKTNNDNNLLLKKVEDLQCALMLKNNENLDIVRKLGSLERELKVLSTKNCALEEGVIANKEVHSLLLKEKEHCSEITLNLKKVTEDVENLRVKKLAWDSEKEQLQAKVAAKESELSLERDIRCRLEKDMMTNIQKVKEEKAQLHVSYSHLLQNYEILKSEVKHSHLISQVHSLNVSDFMSHKSEITVAEPDENLVLKKQLEEKLERQKELSRKNENLATCITGLKVEVNRLCNENESLRESFKVLSEEESRLNALMCIKESEIQGFKRQLEKIIHEKAALLVACKCIQEPTQQREDALGCENKEYSSSVSENGSCTESLRSRRQFIVKVSHRMAEECGTDISEERKLKEQLKVCMEEKAAVSNENERLVTDIRGLQKMLERYCVDNNALEKSLEIVEEEKKRLVSQLSDSHKRLLNVESEVQELKLKTVAMRKDEASQENIGLRFRVKELEAEVEHLQSRKKSLQGSQIVGHNIGKRHALYCPVQSQLAETTSVLKSSVATNTDISGSCQCKELTEKVHELKLTNAQQNNVIGNLKLQIRAEEFPYQQKVKELEERVSFYKSKNMELRRDVRHLNNMIKDSGCDCSRKPKLLQPKHVSVQTDEVKDEEEFLFAGAGGSGIIREDQLMKMRIKIRDLETKTEMLKELCRARRKKILDLEEKLKTALGSQNMTEEENCDSGESKGITKQIRGAGSSQGVGLIQYNKGFSSDDARGQAGNKENFPGRDEALQRPGRNNVRRPLNENFSSTEDVKVPMSD